MLLTLHEMEILCIFHDGTRDATVALLRHAAKNKQISPDRADSLAHLADKLDTLPEDAAVCLAFSS